MEHEYIDRGIMQDIESYIDSKLPAGYQYYLAVTLLKKTEMPGNTIVHAKTAQITNLEDEDVLSLLIKAIHEYGKQYARQAGVDDNDQLLS